jgi:predicted metal-dependent hydrolase
MNPTALTLDGMRVPVDIAGTSRKARLTIEPDGSLRLRAAVDVCEAELNEFLRSKRDWIYRKLTEREALRHEPVLKEFVDGEGFWYLGRSHRLLLSPDTNVARLERGRLIVPSSGNPPADSALITWYSTRGQAWLTPRALDWAQRLKVQPPKLEVADLGRKWGSTDRSRVRIHWATMQLNPTLVDYVLAHELAHLSEPHHGPAFWQLLGRVLPDFEARRERLAAEGTSVWLGSGATT